MTQPIQPSYWNNVDQGVHESANLVTTIQQDIQTLNTSTDYNTLQTIAQKLSSISEGTDAEFALLNNSTLARKFMSGLQAPLAATLANFQLTVNGTAMGTLNDNPTNTYSTGIVNDDYHSNSPNASEFIGDFPPFLANNPAFSAALTNALQNAASGSALGRVGRDSFTFQADGLTVNVDTSSHTVVFHDNDNWVSASLTGTVQAFAKAGYPVTVTPAGGNPAQPLSAYLNQFS